LEGNLEDIETHKKKNQTQAASHHSEVMVDCAVLYLSDLFSALKHFTLKTGHM
jgi:hypothetical protein